MKFLATFPMADRQGGGQQGLIARRTDLWNSDFGDAAMDYTRDELREWVFVLLEQILRRFEVDDFEFTYTRWMHCFPRAKARESHPIMTKFLRRVRKKLDETAEKNSRRLLLGVRVPQTLEECHALGYDVPTWIKERLVDYVAPCDFFYTDSNAKYEEFTALARNSKCMVYPAVMRPENYRAAARNIYAVGADGISQFNYQCHWGRRRSNYPWPASGYPTALAWLRQLQGTDEFDALPPHYLFLPLWSAGSPSGFAKNDRIVRSREVGSRGEYRFRIAEDLGATGAVAELIVTASQSLREDKLVFAINGSPVSPKNIKTIWHANGRDAKFGRPLPPHQQFMIPLSSPPAVFGDNVPQATVQSLDSHGKEDFVIDELEVTVIPPWRRPAR